MSNLRDERDFPQMNEQTAGFVPYSRTCFWLTDGGLVVWHDAARYPSGFIHQSHLLYLAIALVFCTLLSRTYEDR